MTREEILALQRGIEALRDQHDDCLVVSVGTTAADCDGDDGFAIATVRMGRDEGTAQAKYLDDAIRLARRQILDARALREKKRAAEKARGDQG